MSEKTSARILNGSTSAASGERRKLPSTSSARRYSPWCSRTSPRSSTTRARSVPSAISRLLEEVARPFQFVAQRYALGRQVEGTGGVVGQPSGALVHGAQLAAVSEGLLQVVAQDLLVLAHPVTRGDGQPSREPLVQVRSLFLRHGLVGGVADQEVPEAEGVLPHEFGAVGADELLACQGEEAGTHLCAEHLRGERRHRPSVEDLPLHRASLDHRAFLGIQAVEPRGKEELDRRRHREVGQIVNRAPGHRPRTAARRRR